MVLLESNNWLNQKINKNKLTRVGEKFELLSVSTFSDDENS